MNDLWITACLSGLQEGLNPCIFMTSAIFIIHLFFIPTKVRIYHVRWQRFIFCLIFAISALIYNFGPSQTFLFQKDFIFAAKVIYFMQGVGTFILGILLLKDWFLKGPIAMDPKSALEGASQAGSMVNVGLTTLTTVLLALGLSAMATIWPIDKYFYLLGNEAILNHQWQRILPLLVTYVLMSMWPLWVVWAFLSTKNLRPSLVKIVCAAIFFTATSCVIFIFKN